MLNLRKPELQSERGSGASEKTIYPMELENIAVQLFKAQLIKKAECCDEEFKADPIINLGIPKDTTISRGFRLKFQFPDRKKVLFTVEKVISAVQSRKPNYNLYTLQVKREFLPA